MMKKITEKFIHFVGIGGIGISALARYYLGKGYQISGSDVSSSEITDALKKLGAKIYTPDQNKFCAGQVGFHNKKNLSPSTNLVIYSPAVSLSNPEIKEAKRRKIKIQSYPQALGDLTKTHFTIAVSGTHGKSTTTSMLGLLLVRAGLDPTVIVGTKLKEFGDSNFRMGQSQYLVIEADEHFGSFLNYSPRIIVLTAIEADHLDYYKNFQALIQAFKKYVSKLFNDGILIYNKDDKNIKKIRNSKSPKSEALEQRKMSKIHFSPEIRKIGYSLKQNDAKKLKKILKIPGEHNVSNGLAALAVARILNIPDKISFQALSEYKGSWRRFEIIKTKPFILISDYAHHPTEIKATLKAAREKYPKKKIIVVFQPHQYLRTFYLFKGFVKVLREAPVNKLIIADIYRVVGREQTNIKEKVNSEKLVKAINKQSVIYLSTYEEIQKYLKKEIKPGNVVIIMGAGDIYKLISKCRKLNFQR
jgi:UDP-N-acetylmuramate--alanine ligase